VGVFSEGVGVCGGVCDEGMCVLGCACVWFWGVRGGVCVCAVRMGGVWGVCVCVLWGCACVW
jgi:hypothetical protein